MFWTSAQNFTTFDVAVVLQPCRWAGEGSTTGSAAKSGSGRQWMAVTKEFATRFLWLKPFSSPLAAVALGWYKQQEWRAAKEWIMANVECDDVRNLYLEHTVLESRTSPVYIPAYILRSTHMGEHPSGRQIATSEAAICNWWHMCQCAALARAYAVAAQASSPRRRMHSHSTRMYCY